MLPANLRLYEKFSVTKIEALTNANKIIIPIRRNLEFLTQVFPTKKDFDATKSFRLEKF